MFGLPEAGVVLLISPKYLILQIKPTIAMPVPASYNDLTTDDSLRDHLGVVWYERKFFVSHDWSLDKRIWLRFGSVHYAAIVVSFEIMYGVK